MGSGRRRTSAGVQVGPAGSGGFVQLVFPASAKVSEPLFGPASLADSDSAQNFWRELVRDSRSIISEFDAVCRSLNWRINQISKVDKKKYNRTT